MRSQRVWRCMSFRTKLVMLLVLALAVVVSGCVASEVPPAADVGAASIDAAAPAPFAAEGVAWLPPSEGNERAVTEIAFDVNASGMAGDVALRLGERWVVDLPTSIADVVVEVRDAADAVLASAQLRAGQMEATLALEDLAQGPHRLVLLSYGGSGGGMGEYVAWRIAVA